MQSVLVTGSSGLIGYRVARALAQDGVGVTGLDPAPTPAEDEPAFEVVRGSLDDVHRLYRLLSAGAVDTVIHCGAISGPMLALDDPHLICATNLIGTIHLIEAARSSGVGRFVYCSSGSAFGDTPPGPVADDAPIRPNELYGATKGACDLILGAYRRQYGLDAVSLRISTVYGPHRRTDCAIQTMIVNALARSPTHFAWGADQRRPYVHVDDVVRSVIAAAKAERIGQPAYNIAGPDFPAYPQIAEIIAELIPGTEITFEPGMQPGGTKRDQMDLSAAERDLGYVPTVTIEDGVRSYVEALRAGHDGP